MTTRTKNRTRASRHATNTVAAAALNASGTGNLYRRSRQAKQDCCKQHRNHCWCN